MLNIPINLESIEKAASRISLYIDKSPVFHSSILNEKFNHQIYFKCEHLQKTGSFKIRGALNSIISKADRKSLNGVITHSSGNHGQAVAFAAKLLNYPAIVIVPKNTSLVKISAIKTYGAKIEFCENSFQSRSETCERLANENDYEIIPPYDDYDTILGQATVGLEFIQQVPHLDAVLISISGGGLSSGCAIALKSINKDIKIYCVEPEGKHLESSFRQNERLWRGPVKMLNTIAEGIRIEQPGLLTFPILCQYAEKNVLTVTDEDMIDGMNLVMTYLKQVIEPAAGAAVGALVKYLPELQGSQNIGVILCGGNVDLPALYQSLKN